MPKAGKANSMCVGQEQSEAARFEAAQKVAGIIRRVRYYAEQSPDSELRRWVLQHTENVESYLRTLLGLDAEKMETAK